MEAAVQTDSSSAARISKAASASSSTRENLFPSLRFQTYLRMKRMLTWRRGNGKDSESFWSAIRGILKIEHSLAGSFLSYLGLKTLLFSSSSFILFLCGSTRRPTFPTIIQRAKKQNETVVSIFAVRLLVSVCFGVLCNRECMLRGKKKKKEKEKKCTRSSCVYKRINIVLVAVDVSHWNASQSFAARILMKNHGHHWSASNSRADTTLIPDFIRIARHAQWGCKCKHRRCRDAHKMARYVDEKLPKFR